LGSITITVSGLGSPTYERSGAVLYDNHFAGTFAGNFNESIVAASTSA